MPDPAIDIESVTERVIGCAIEVHRVMGPGLLESVYQECMTEELRLKGLKAHANRRIAIEYKGRALADALKIDLLVEGVVIVELKAVERLHAVHLAQVITYLKLSGCPAGLLMNFNATTIKAGLRRLYHPGTYRTAGRSRD
jgi:GxxExxY protein